MAIYFSRRGAAGRILFGIFRAIRASQNEVVEGGGGGGDSYVTTFISQGQY